MLEGVGVDLAAFQRLVGLRVVVEHDSLDLQAALVGLLCDDTPNVLVLAGDDADLDDLRLRNSWLGPGEGRERDGRGKKCGEARAPGDQSGKKIGSLWKFSHDDFLGMGQVRKGCQKNLTLPRCILPTALAFRQSIVLRDQRGAWKKISKFSGVGVETIRKLLEPIH